MLRHTFPTCWETIKIIVLIKEEFERPCKPEMRRRTLNLNLTNYNLGSDAINFNGCVTRHYFVSVGVNCSVSPKKACRMGALRLASGGRWPDAGLLKLNIELWNEPPTQQQPISVLWQGSWLRLRLGLMQSSLIPRVWGFTDCAIKPY